MFYEKYKIPLKHIDILNAGLTFEESSKPLFCRMLALIYEEKKTIILAPNLKLNKTLLYYEVIHNIVLGKESLQSTLVESNNFYGTEKQILRKIAELKYIFGDSLTIKTIKNNLTNFEVTKNENFIQFFDKLISSYFYIEETKYEQRIDFIHKSFVEYLVAEFYLECCFMRQFDKINMSSLTFETISFLEGLLCIIKLTDDDNNSFYFKKIMESFNVDYQSKSKLRDNLIKLAETYFEEEKSLIPKNVNEYQGIEDIIDHRNLQNHRWISILILNVLDNKKKLDNKKFFNLVQSSNNSLIGNIITIENIDLSFSELIYGFGNYNLSGINLSNSTFSGVFNGTKFIGANLSNSLIKHGTKFIGVDFSGANLSNIKVEILTDVSPFGFHFIDCKFDYCKLIDAVLKDTSFTLSNFDHTDFSGAKLIYADLSLTNMREIILNSDTNTKNINLLSKGYYYEWENIRDNKELIRILMDKFDPINFDRKMREKIMIDNPDY